MRIVCDSPLSGLLPVKSEGMRAANVLLADVVRESCVHVGCGCGDRVTASDAHLVVSIRYWAAIFWWAAASCGAVSSNSYRSAVPAHQ